jgi:transposase
MAERVRVRVLTNDEGNRLLRILRRGQGSVVTWRRAQMVLLSAQGMEVGQIARVAFTSEDRVREVLHNFNDDGFNSLYPRYAGGRPPKFSLPQRREIKKIALSRPTDHDLPFSTWSLSKLAEFLVAEGVVDDISHEGLRVLLREEGVSFQRLKTWKQSTDPDFEAKKSRILHLYGIADGTVEPEAGDPTVVICVDEFGPLNLQPHPGRQWALAGGGGSTPRRRRRATYTRPNGVRHLLAAYDLSTAMSEEFERQWSQWTSTLKAIPPQATREPGVCGSRTLHDVVGHVHAYADRLYRHIKVRKNRPAFRAFLRYVRSLHPADVRIAGSCSTTSAPRLSRHPGLGRRPQRRVGLRAVLRILAQPHRGPVHGPALLRPRRHRPWVPRGAGAHDPALHRLAQPQRQGQRAS